MTHTSRARSLLILLALLLLASRGSNPTPHPSLIHTGTSTSIPTPTSEFAAPPSTGPEPSYKVAAFYYPWYGNPRNDDQWRHWTQNGHQPPLDIASDYYPALGPYSSNDPAVVAQHMAWLREAGVGVIAVSWWGRGSPEDQALPLILQTAARYDIKVAFHIEPYRDRTADDLIADVKYIYQQYGNSPAFFQSTATSTYSTGSQPKGLFFVWCTSSPGNCGSQKVDASYWQPALDAIHALPEGGLVIANTTDGSAIAKGHFDGLYNYATLHLEQHGGFSWAHTLPPGALYVPSVIPGMSAKRVGYPDSTFVPRNNGQTYDDQWTAALNTGVEPFMVTITSFNEWHEGTVIEPAATGKNNGSGYSYADFGTLPPDGYLALTRQWIGKFQSTALLPSVRARIQIKTTSDWTTLNIISGGYWMHPQLVSASQSATRAGFESGDSFILTQSMDGANSGQSVEMVWDVELTGLAPGGMLSLEIDRGNIGSTEVTLYSYAGGSPLPVGSFTWSGTTTGRNGRIVNISADKLLGPGP